MYLFVGYLFNQPGVGDQNSHWFGVFISFLMHFHDLILPHPKFWRWASHSYPLLELVSSLINEIQHHTIFIISLELQSNTNLVCFFSFICCQYLVKSLCSCNFTVFLSETAYKWENINYGFDWFVSFLLI